MQLRPQLLPDISRF